MSVSTTYPTDLASTTVRATPGAAEQRDREEGDYIPSQHTTPSAPVTDNVRGHGISLRTPAGRSADDVGDAVSHGVDRGVDAGPQLELDRRLVQQHPNPVHGVGAGVTSSGEPRGRQRTVDQVDDGL